MKKVLSLVLALVMCLSLCACGGSKGKNAKATIIKNDGETVEMSAKELIMENDANEAKFLKLYSGASVEFVGTVETVKVGDMVYTRDGIISKQNKIVFTEGWCLTLGSNNDKYDLSDYYVGQKLKVSTGVVGAFYENAFDETGDKVIWLVGNDNLWGYVINKQTTTISVVE